MKQKLPLNVLTIIFHLGIEKKRNDNNIAFTNGWLNNRFKIPNCVTSNVLNNNNDTGINYHY